MYIPEDLTVENVIRSMLNRHSICVDCAAEARVKEFAADDPIVKNNWKKCEEFHEMRADVIFDILKVVAGSEDLAVDWIKEYDN